MSLNKVLQPTLLRHEEGREGERSKAEITCQKATYNVIIIIISSPCFDCIVYWLVLTDIIAVWKDFLMKSGLEGRDLLIFLNREVSGLLGRPQVFCLC